MRTCDKCGKHMTKGFVVGDDYFCSEECLFQEMTEQDYLVAYEDGYAYYTEWEDEEPELMSYWESAMIGLKFFEDCFAFWKREGETHWDAFTGAYEDLRALRTNPFDPNGQVLNRDAINCIAKTIKDVMANIPR